MTSPTTYQVRFWQLKHVKDRRRPWGVRWVTGGQEHSEWYSTKALAESFRADLVRAARVGEAFDTRSGLPLSVARQVLLTIYAKCLDGQTATFNARIDELLGE